MDKVNAAFEQKFAKDNNNPPEEIEAEKPPAKRKRQSELPPPLPRLAPTPKTPRKKPAAAAEKKQDPVSDELAKEEEAKLKVRLCRQTKKLRALIRKHELQSQEYLEEDEPTLKMSLSELQTRHASAKAALSRFDLDKYAPQGLSVATRMLEHHSKITPGFPLMLDGLSAAVDENVEVERALSELCIDYDDFFSMPPMRRLIGAMAVSVAMTHKMNEERAAGVAEVPTEVIDAAADL